MEISLIAVFTAIVFTIFSRRNTYRFFFSILFFYLFLTPLNASAQNVPSGDQPGAQGSRFQAESERERKRLERERVEAPRIDIEEEKEAAPAAEGPAFLLKDVRITGTTIFKPEDLLPVYKARIGRQVTFRDLEDIVSAIKAKYKEKGYLSTDVYIPEQDIADGRAEIRVSEGVLGEVKVEGAKWFSGEVIKKFIHVKKMNY